MKYEDSSYSTFNRLRCFATSSLSVRAIDATTTTTTTQTTATGVPAGAAPAYSGSIPDVVTLAKSGVDESVVVSFIKNSPGPFQPGADEIIRLRDAGLTSREISAMLERGGEVRAQAVAAAPAYPGYNYAQGPMPTAGPAPVITAPPDAYADSDYSAQPASSVVYVGGDYGYPYYGGYYGYPYFYPYACWYNGCYYPHGCYFPRGGFGGFRGGFGGVGFRGGFAGGGIRTGFAGGGFRGGVIGGGFHGAVGGGFHGAVGGGFHGASGGGFHGGGGRR